MSTRIAKPREQHLARIKSNWNQMRLELNIVGPRRRAYIWVGQDLDVPLPKGVGRTVYVFNLTPRIKAALRKALR